MKTPMQAKLKQWPHSRVRRYFETICTLRPYGERLLRIDFGLRLRRELDDVRLAVCDTIEDRMYDDSN